MTNKWTLDELIDGAAQAERSFGPDVLEAGQDAYINEQLNRGRLHLVFPDEVCVVLNRDNAYLEAMVPFCQGQSSDLIFEDSRYQYRIWVRRGDDGDYLAVEKYREGQGWELYYTRDEFGHFDRA
jgi:hypothetical protein